jgi:UDP-N-acetylmuramoyl-tripeptide--D-alanyl-D-alanine ligase
MIPLSAETAARALGIPSAHGPVTGVSTDTRTLRQGDLFVALRGDSYDGNQFVPAALASGASCAVVDLGAAIAGDVEYRLPNGCGLYRVPDTLRALAALAREVRRASSAKVVAVTGSVGKTSTKDLIRGMASSALSVIATAANQNNEIGVPLTLLEIDEGTDMAVVEMGMRGKGQIRELTLMAEPDVAVITAIAPVHLELLGHLDDVIAAKVEIFEGLRPGGAAVVPADEPEVVAAAERSGARVVTFSFVDERRAGGRVAPGSADPVPADVTGTALSDGNGGALLRLTWPGGVSEVRASFRAAHRLRNAVAAAAACFAAGLPMDRCVAGLAEVDFTPLRGDEVLVGGVFVVDDTYNASPAAVRLALDDLMISAEASGRRPIAVLGDMLELGPGAASFHREVGAYAAEAGVEVLLGLGPLSCNTVEAFLHTSSGRDAAWVPEVDSALETIEAVVRSGDVVLFKGSRGMKLDRVVERLVASLSEPARTSETENTGS